MALLLSLAVCFLSTSLSFNVNSQRYNYINTIRYVSMTVNDFPNIIANEISNDFLIDTAKILKRTLSTDTSIVNSITLVSPQIYLSNNNNKRSTKTKYVYIIDENSDTYSSTEQITISNQVDYIFATPSSIQQNTPSWNRLVLKLADILTKINTNCNPRDNINLNAGQWSHFLSLTYPKIDDALSHNSDLFKGIDAIELRVDLLADQSYSSIHRQIALLRSVSDLPIVYTVRSIGQIGTLIHHSYRIYILIN